MALSHNIHWVAAIDPDNYATLTELEQRMAGFYLQSSTYYRDIQFGQKAWVSDPAYSDIAKRARGASSILEVGCGAAHLLTYYPDLAIRYTGCDLSKPLIESNAIRFPLATFRSIDLPRRLPFDNSAFDLVFSTYVIEHVVFPHIFLDECVRVLAPGGQLIIRCPDFLGRGVVTSQRAGFSYGNGRDKLLKGKIWDAIITGFDRKVKIPLRCAIARKQIGKGWRFFINSQPVCFEDSFAPDHDAVYLTHAPEIIAYLHGRVRFMVSNIQLGIGGIYLAGFLDR